MSAGAIRSTSATTTASGSCRSPGATSRSRSSTASTRRRPTRARGGTLVLDDAAQRAAQGGAGAQPLPRDRAAVRAARAARHRPRRRRRDADAEARRDGQLHDAEARRRAAVWAPASASATTSRWRCPTTRAPTTSPSAPSGRTRRTCCASPTAGRGSTTSRRRWSGTARSASTTSPDTPGTRTHVALAVELGADDQLRRLHQAGAQDAGHRLLLLRPVEQQRAAAAVHDQFGAGADSRCRARTRMPKRTSSRRT